MGVTFRKHIFGQFHGFSPEGCRFIEMMQNLMCLSSWMVFLCRWKRVCLFAWLLEYFMSIGHSRQHCMVALYNLGSLCILFLEEESDHCRNRPMEFPSKAIGVVKGGSGRWESMAGGSGRWEVYDGDAFLGYCHGSSQFFIWYCSKRNSNDTL